MLPRSHRLTHPDHFKDAYRRGVSAAGAYVVIHCAQQGAEPAQIGFVTSKKVGNSVMRHRIKRQLRHIMRERLGQCPSGARIVVRALPAAAGCTTAQLSADIDRTWQRVMKRLDRQRSDVGKKRA